MRAILSPFNRGAVVAYRAIFLSGSPSADDEGKSEKKQQCKTDEAEGAANAWRVEQCAGSDSHSKRPEKIARASAESQSPGGPEPAAFR